MVNVDFEIYINLYPLTIIVERSSAERTLVIVLVCFDMSVVDEVKKDYFALSILIIFLRHGVHGVYVLISSIVYRYIIKALDWSGD